MFLTVPLFATPDAPADAEPIDYVAIRVSREEAARRMAVDPRCRPSTVDEIATLAALEELQRETRAR